MGRTLKKEDKSEGLFRINEKDTRQIAECMKKISLALRGAVNENQPEISICTMEIAGMFGWQHTKVFNMISRYVTVNAEESEKKEFRFAERVYRVGTTRTHSVCYLTEKGCRIFLDKICAGDIRKSKKFVEGAEKLRQAIDGASGQRKGILMDGRSRSECGKIKELFDRFITGPAIENREIAELTEKYQVFHDVMKEMQLKVKDSNEIESAVYGVAIEAEMQGFIYGFKLYEELLNRQLATA